MDNKSGSHGNFWLGFFLGGLIGGFIIFLMGTKKGNKLLEKIIDQTELYEEKLEEKLEDLHEKGENLFAEAENVKEKISQEVTSGKKTISSSLMTKMDETLGKIEDIQKKGIELTEEVKHNYFRKNGKRLTS